MGLETGNFVISKAGHDKGRVYVILGTDKDRVLVADGKAHSVDVPKKKNPMHLQPVNHGIGQELLERLNTKSLRNEEIRLAIKSWTKQETDKEDS